MSAAQRIHSMFPQMELSVIQSKLSAINEKDLVKILERKYGAPRVALSEPEKIAKIVKKFPYVSEEKAREVLDAVGWNILSAAEECEILEPLPCAFEEEEEEKHKAITVDEMSNNKDTYWRYDMHRYSAKQVKFFMETVITAARASQYAERIDLIVGKGKHSSDGIAHIRRLSLKFANKMNVHAVIDPNNQGIVSLFPKQPSLPDDFEEEEWF